MAEENKNNDAVNNQNPSSNEAGSAGVRPNSGANAGSLNSAKKPKTARQIERERARRRRRRQKKAGLDSTKDNFKAAIPKTTESKDLNKPAVNYGDLEKVNLKETENQSEINKSETNKPFSEENSQVLNKTASEQKKDLIENQQKDSEILKTEVIIPSAETNFPPFKEKSEQQEIKENEDQEKINQDEAISNQSSTESKIDIVESEVQNAQDLQSAEPTETKLAENLPIFTETEQPVDLIKKEEPVTPDLAQIEHSEQAPEKPSEPLKNITLEKDDKVIGSSYSSTADNWIPNLKKAEEQQVLEEENHPNVEEIVPEEEVHEDYLQQTYQEKAKEIAKNLLGEEPDHLDELPVKQGILGKFFDWLSNQTKKKTAKVKINVSSEETNILARLNLIKFWPFLKNMLALSILIILVILAFWIGSSLKLYDQIMALFGSKSSQEQLVTGDNNKVIYDAELLKKLGFETGRLFSINDGNIADLGYNMFFNANYFGKLKEPVFKGETGISAAIYYGFGKDIQFIKNRFVYYVKFLQKLNNAYSVNLSDLFKGELRRDEILNKYLTENKALFEEGNTYRKEINIQVDDLKISLNSIAPDKDKSEADFFAFLANLNGEQADLNLQKFIEISQKQVEIKAKLATMSKLAEYYLAILTKLKVRLEAIEKNQDALIGGIQVVDIPESNLDLVKKNQ